MAMEQALDDMDKHQDLVDQLLSCDLSNNFQHINYHVVATPVRVG